MTNEELITELASALKEMTDWGCRVCPMRNTVDCENGNWCDRKKKNLSLIDEALPTTSVVNHR